MYEIKGVHLAAMGLSTNKEAARVPEIFNAPIAPTINATTENKAITNPFRKPQKRKIAKQIK